MSTTYKNRFRKRALARFLSSNLEETEFTGHFRHVTQRRWAIRLGPIYTGTPLSPLARGASDAAEQRQPGRRTRVYPGTPSSGMTRRRKGPEVLTTTVQPRSRLRRRRSRRDEVCGPEPVGVLPIDHYLLFVQA